MQFNLAMRPAAVVIAFLGVAATLVIVGVVSSTEDEPTAAPTTTTVVTVADVANNEQIFARATAVLASPTSESVAALANAMGESSDPAWVPYLIDMLRMYGAGGVVEPIAASLANLTGEPLPGDFRLIYATYGRWLHAEEPIPYEPLSSAQGYIGWKSLLYAQVDLAFAGLIGQIDDPILASQIQWGGVRRGGIPELNAPVTVSVAEADWMTDGELTFGAVVNGEARAFPHRILDFHELANDTLGGEPVALANCTLCRTGILYSRRVGDRVLSFQSSGLLWNSNKVMVDIETDTLWNQLTGEAIAGELKGTVLDRFLITVTTYGEWIVEHPDTAVLDIPGRALTSGIRNEIVGGYSYEPGDAYAEYYASPDVWWPAAEVPDVFAEKDLIATLDLDGEQLAVGVDALAAGGPQVFTVAGQTVVAVPTDGGARFYGRPDEGSVLALVLEDAGEDTLVLADGSELLRLQSGHSFWFAWYANFSDTAWWPG
ncbi:MAG: hypothetical protein BMS9Abin07_1288 [Acidimicrobiia bacterium]|nr:MAG: hypothetical protein BMS9Abin07_1288 [Acidimicrobiia bacterium]